MKDSFQKGFDSAKKKAEKLVQDKEATKRVLEEAIAKADKNKGILKTSKEDFFLLLRMLSAWTTGKYKAIPLRTVVSAVGAVLYFLNPMDIIPDFIAGAGFFDDLTILGFVISFIKDDLEKFKIWEKDK